MDIQNSPTPSTQENILGLVDSLIRDVPEVCDQLGNAGHPTNGTSGTVDTTRQSSKTNNRRVMKLKQQLAKQNKYISDLKNKIQTLAGLTPKSMSDHEELAFLRIRLDKESEQLKTLLKNVIEEQKKDKTQTWEPIPLCSDPFDDVCRNAWVLGNVSTPGQRFSYDSNLSSLSSNEQVDSKEMNERFEKEQLKRDRVIEILQNRVDALTADVMKVKRDNDVVLNKTPKQSKFCEADMMNRLRFYKNNTDALERNLNQMGTALNIIRSELGTNLTGDLNEPIGFSTFIGQSNNSTMRDEGTKTIIGPKQDDDHYNTLLKELSRKSNECKKLTDRMAKACSCQNTNIEQSELELLKRRCSELMDEQEEFKILMKEQSDQLEEYRNKYLEAQQNVEEQKLQLDKMDVANRRIEEQINIEVQRIKTKFQDKLRQLAPFPQLLEAEEQRVKDLKKSNENLLEELKMSAKEIKALEYRLHNIHASQNIELEKAHDLLKIEIGQISELLKESEKSKAKLEEKLTASQKELDEVRSETARIIARAQDRAQEDRRTALAKQHALEKELAQCRAAAAVTISNRDEALREMQGQIGVLSASFDDAQIQIHSLRNQLTFMRNEQHGPRI
ncbi:myosin-10 [Topomyia yanbarensis]|uniref:myosin-10 n=1 Tax=Topomyia yanbarensis TaxID=2498891 RepID=UPI00273B5270|nr:myosin-10 [Topomyia yanbarensis]